MVERAYLDKSLVDSAEPPLKGERWLADTQIKGFGLRIWRNKDGEARAAYCVRVSNPEGKAIRRSLSYWNCRYFHISLLDNHERWEYERSFNPDETLGDLISTARVWAKDTITGIKKTGPTISDIRAEVKQAERAHKKTFLERLSSYTLEKSSDIIIAGLRNQKKSEEYCIRVDTLFYNSVSKRIKKTLTHKLRPEDFKEIFQSAKLTRSGIKTLRGHLRKCVEMALYNGLKTATKPTQIVAIAFDALENDVRENIFDHFDASHQDRIINALMSETEYWQQSLCLFLFLESHLPLSQLLKATWANFDLKLHDNIDAIANKDRVFMHFGKSWRSRGALDERQIEALKTIQKHNLRLGLSDKYLFPSTSYTNKNYPITSIKTALTKIRKNFDLPDVSPADLRRDWHESEAFHDRTMAAIARRLMRHNNQH